MGHITKILIANRGEISCRAQKACRDIGIGHVAVYTEQDALSLHVLQAEQAVCLGSQPKEYLNGEKLLKVCKETGADAVFPGYGFLSENVEFAKACEEAGVQFIGPTPETMESFSQKHTARAIAENAGVPVLPGTSLLTSADEAIEACKKVGLPVLLKATGGGGGIGIHICRTEQEVGEKFQSAVRQGAAAFGDSGVFLEKYVEHARHIEIQIFGDGLGNIIAFPERECSIQRRHQKVVEETPSPFVSSRLDVRKALQKAATDLGAAIKYRSAGTVEFILDDDTGNFYFLEVNTRLQVEHGITEMVSNVDLVAWQFQLQGAVYKGEDPKKILKNVDTRTIEPIGHAIEVRLCAEDPTHDYRPCTGIMGEVSWPTNARVDTWIATGTEVSAFYDSLLAKVMVFSPEGRTGSIPLMQEALSKTVLKGVITNLSLNKGILGSAEFEAGKTTTKFLETFNFNSEPLVEVLDPGLMTTVQDYPGRKQMWNVGVPPSGPMDDYSHRLANALLGNPENASTLEVTLSGPTLKFTCTTQVAVCGMDVDVTVDGAGMPTWEAITIPAGAVLRVGDVKKGSRAYIAIKNGLEVPLYLGSKATFPGGGFGGHQGRALRAGDVIPLGEQGETAGSQKIPTDFLPDYPVSEEGIWEIKVLLGPQSAPDYFTQEDVDDFFSTIFKVHHNSNRLGIRLDGPRPRFARKDGGDGGSHPSNVHDHVYAIGAINYTGDMPVVLTIDGPSLGGFVCPVTVISSEMWKMGQVRPGDSIKFIQTSLEDAAAGRLLKNQVVRALTSTASGQEGHVVQVQQTHEYPATKAILLEIENSDDSPNMIVRLAGDRYIFIEFGPMELDLNLRVRVKLLEEKLNSSNLEGFVEASPGVRSLMVEYEPDILPLTTLLKAVEHAEKDLGNSRNLHLPSRVIHLPIAFDESSTKSAIEKYTRSVRSKAPYLPSNIDFIAQNNGVHSDTKEYVKSVVLSASYMVLGLGDVYLGAPCAVPVDPLHRLVVPKYNPARTFTPEGSVGIGGSYVRFFVSPDDYCLR